MSRGLQTLESLVLDLQKHTNSQNRLGVSWDISKMYALLSNHFFCCDRI